MMFLDRRIILTIVCLMASTMGRTPGEESKKSRSPNNRGIRPLEIRRPNSIQTDDRVYNRDFISLDYSTKPDYLDRSNSPSSDAASISTIDDEQRELQEEEEDEWFRDITSKDYEVSSPSDLANFHRIGDRMIARANITEEAKRVVRQVKKQRPGFFWTLARVAFETVNETRSAVQQISSLVQGSISPETTTLRGGAAIMSTTTQATTTSGDNSTDTEMEPTEEPYVLTVSGIQSLIRRNLRGLVRLFNIEWRDAINQSQANVREFQRDLSNGIRPFLQDNPDVV